MLPSPRSRPSLRAGIAALSVLLATLVVGSSSGSAEAVTPRDWGVALPGVPGDLSALSSLSSALADQPGTVMWYDAWSNKTAFPVASANAVAATGSNVAVTWEPWDPARGTVQRAYTTNRIASGAFDRYLRTYAASVRSYGKPVTIRFAHEMNGSWYPWSAGVNGNAAADYVAAFRHVHGVFAAAGVTNVTWAWVPNVPYAGSTSLASLYPGDAFVDEVGLDGYNWGTTQTWSAWQTFWQVFGPGVAQLQALTSRPIWLGEVGSTETGGDKAAWVADMFATLAAHPEVRGFTWFSYDKETDWRIDSSPASLDAFRAGLATYQ